MKVELIRITPHAEQLIEQAARICYQSNSRATDSSADKLLPALLKSGHESPFEHAYATYVFNGVSRTMTHQLVRHRLIAVSQKSQRYVSELQFEFVIPHTIADIMEEDEYTRDMKLIDDMYKKWIGKGIPKEDARFVLPNACTSEIMISGNFREMRHIFKMRCSKHAQWEIREVACDMLKKIYAVAPLVFQDLYDKFIINEKV